MRSWMNVTLAAAVLCGCASKESQLRLEAANAKVQQAVAPIAFAPSYTNGVSDQNSAQLQNCATTYETDYNYRLTNIQAIYNQQPDAALSILSSLAPQLDQQFVSCTQLAGSAGFMFVRTSQGEVTTLQTYLDRIVTSGSELRAAQAQINQEKTRTALALGAVAIGVAAVAIAANNGGFSSPSTGYRYVNPDKIWVDGYYRADGTYVRGHWRTKPNGTCADNIGGC